MSSLGVPSRYVNTRKSSVKSKRADVEKRNPSQSVIQQNSKTKKINDKSKKDGIPLDMKFAEYLDKIEREKVEQSLNKRPNWNSNVQKRKTTEESSLISAKPIQKKRKTLKKSIAKRISRSSKTVSRVYDTESSSSNLGPLFSKESSPSSQLSYAAASRERARKNIQEANTFLQQLSDSSDDDYVQRKPIKNPFVVPSRKSRTRKTKSEIIVDDNESTDSSRKHSSINKAIEISNKQMRINKALLDNLDDSSSESELDVSHPQAVLRKNETKLVISQPIAFATSNALTEEIEQLWKLVNELKNINSDLRSRKESSAKNVNQNQPDEQDSYISKSSHVSSSDSYNEDVPPPKQESPKPVQKTYEPLNQASSSSSSFDEKEKVSKTENVFSYQVVLSSDINAEEEEEEEETPEILASKIKAHLRNSPFVKSKLSSSTNVTTSQNDEEEEEDNQPLNKSGKIIWSSAEENDIESLGISSESQEKNEKSSSPKSQQQQHQQEEAQDYIEEEEDYSSPEFNIIPPIPMNRVDNNVEHDPNYAERREAWERRFDNPTSSSAGEEETAVRSTVRQSRESPPHVTIIHEMHSSSSPLASPNESEPQRGDSNIIADQIDRSAFTLLTDSSDDDIPLSGRVSTSTDSTMNQPQVKTESIPQNQSAKQDDKQSKEKSTVRLTPEQWSRFFNSDDSDDELQPSPSIASKPTIESTTVQKPVIINEKKEANWENGTNEEEEDDDFDEEEIRRFIQQSMQHIKNNGSESE